MSKVRIIPPPAPPAPPPAFEVTLTLEEAALVRGLLGACRGRAGGTLYRELSLALNKADYAALTSREAHTANPHADTVVTQVLAMKVSKGTRQLPAQHEPVIHVTLSVEDAKDLERDLARFVCAHSTGAVSQGLAAELEDVLYRDAGVAYKSGDEEPAQTLGPGWARLRRHSDGLVVDGRQEDDTNDYYVPATYRDAEDGIVREWIFDYELADGEWERL